MFERSETDKAKQLSGDWRKIAQRIESATAARRTVDADLQAAIQQLRDAVAAEALGEGSPKAVTDARADVATHQGRIKSADELLDALHRRLVGVAAQMGDALPALHDRIAEETEELRVQLERDIAAAFAKMAPLFARRRALERLGVAIPLPEHDAAMEPALSELAPARHYCREFQTSLHAIIRETVPGVSEGCGLLAGCSPELVEIVRKAQAVGANLQLNSIARENAERRQRAAEAAPAAPVSADRLPTNFAAPGAAPKVSQWVREM